MSKDHGDLEKLVPKVMTPLHMYLFPFWASNAVDCIGRLMEVGTVALRWKPAVDHM